LGLLRGRIAFNEIRVINPKITYERSLPAVPKKSEPAITPVLKPQESAVSSVVSAVSNITSLPANITAVTEGVANAVNAVTLADTTNTTAASTNTTVTTVPAATVPSAVADPPKSEKPLLSSPQKRWIPPLICKYIVIKDGQLDFIDRGAGPKGLKITVKEIYLELNNLYLVPRSAVANFELRARIPWQEDEEEGRLEAIGWVNLYKKEMQATLKIHDIDGVYLYPYYSTWVDLEKARIQKAKLNFASNIEGINNDITAKCHLELTDIVRTPRSADEPQEKAEKITDVVLDIFRSLNQGKIVLDFTIRTKMDYPEFGFANIKMAFEDKLAMARKGGALHPDEVLKLPGRLLEGTVKSARDLSKAMLDGVFAIGNGIKKTAEDSFKKEPKEEDSLQ
jgi:hypothetical protein